MTTARRLFKEVSMHYLCKKCLECEFLNFEIKENQKYWRLDTEIQ